MGNAEIQQKWGEVWRNPRCRAYSELAFDLGMYTHIQKSSRELWEKIAQTGQPIGAFASLGAGMVNGAHNYIDHTKGTSRRPNVLLNDTGYTVTVPDGLEEQAISRALLQILSYDPDVFNNLTQDQAKMRVYFRDHVELARYLVSSAFDMYAADRDVPQELWEFRYALRKVIDQDELQRLKLFFPGHPSTTHTPPPLTPDEVKTMMQNLAYENGFEAYQLDGKPFEQVQLPQAMTAVEINSLLNYVDGDVMKQWIQKEKRKLATVSFSNNDQLVVADDQSFFHPNRMSTDAFVEFMRKEGFTVWQHISKEDPKETDNGYIFWNNTPFPQSTNDFLYNEVHHVQIPLSTQSVTFINPNT